MPPHVTSELAFTVETGHLLVVPRSPLLSHGIRVVPLLSHGFVPLSHSIVLLRLDEGLPSINAAIQVFRRFKAPNSPGRRRLPPSQLLSGPPSIAAVGASRRSESRRLRAKNPGRQRPDASGTAHKPGSPVTGCGSSLFGLPVALPSSCVAEPGTGWRPSPSQGRGAGCAHSPPATGARTCGTSARSASAACCRRRTP